MNKPTGSVVRGLVTLTYSGSLANADGAVTGTLYKNGASDVTVTVTVYNVSTGLYSYSYTIPGGYAENDDLQVVLSGTVGTGTAFKLVSETVIVKAAVPTAAAVVAAIEGKQFGSYTLEQWFDGLPTASEIVAAQANVYHADLQLTLDDTNSQDEWTVVWFKNGIRQTSGITSPQIQLVKRSDGTDLLAATNMTQIGATGAYKYDATSTARITEGEAVLAIVTATIDGSTRTWAKVVFRDKNT